MHPPLAASPTCAAQVTFLHRAQVTPVLPTGNDVYRKNAWVAVYELVRQSPSSSRARGGGLKQRIGRLVGQVVNALPRVRLPWRGRQQQRG